MEELTSQQRQELEEHLHRLLGELQSVLASSEEGSRPVDLGQPIGRLSRMDAMQQQSVVQANRRNHELRLTRVRSALEAIESGEYGECRMCGEPIGYPRLKARPETPLCLSCQNEREARR
jgi:DnaK suppressor protein